MCGYKWENIAAGKWYAKKNSLPGYNKDQIIYYYI